MKEEKEVAKDSTQKKKYLLFTLAERKYAIALANIKEVISDAEVTPLPNVPSYYKGLINLRGQIISIIDLRLKLGFEPHVDKERKECIIICFVGSSQVGAIIDEVLQVQGFYDSQIDVSEAERLHRETDGVYGVAKSEHHELVLLIDLNKSLRNIELSEVTQ